ncbi:MAG: T9SS type A sorting domain-containing protein [candidate division Zixibacteria bacterium]
MKKVTVFALLPLMLIALLMNVASSEQNAKSDALRSLKADFPGIRAYSEGQNITRVFGKQIGNGSSPENSAELFKNEYVELFGVSPGDLKPGSNLVGGLRTLPLMYNKETGERKFTLVYYSQYGNDIPVFRADLGLLVRNESGFPLVMAASALRDLDGFEVPLGVGINAPMAQNAVKSFYAELINFSEPRLVIWAGINDQIVRPAVAMEIIADNDKYATPDYEKWLFLVDALTGELLYTEDMILNTDITGNVSGMATEGWGADICSTEAVTSMPYVRAEIQGGEWVYADESGDFVIPNDGDLEDTVISEIRGQWFRVNNQYGSNARLTESVIPPGPVNFIHNETNNREHNLAEVNGYIHANVVRDYTLTYNDTFPTIRDQENFPVNVNLNDNCNAYYDYSSINFYTSGGGCANTAFSTVVHHEYGHHLVAVAGSGQGQYGEGLGDVMGVLISGESGLAYGFFNNCSQPMRDADNNLQYPCTGEIHACGRLISGCIWDLRNELMANYPDEYEDIIGTLLTNSIPLHRGDLITPSITIDFLVLDDDDGDIDNGTPHYDEICAGFGAHNMDCPVIVLIDFDYPDGLPELVNPSGETTVAVEVIGVTENPEPGTGMLYYNDGSGWESIAMDESPENDYVGTFPEFECGSTISYYFSAETEGGTLVTDPGDAPATTFSAFAATGYITIFADDFETDQGWVVENSSGLTDGQWDRGIPVNCQRGDPDSDYDGSGQCYLTDNDAGNGCNSDVDGGNTYLISPAFDLTDMEVIFRFALWYTNGFGDDPHNDVFNVWISPNDGADWSIVETIGPVSAAEWLDQWYIIDDFITPTNEVRFRFDVSDLNQGSIVEAAIDAFEIVGWECEPTDIADEIDDIDLPVEFALMGSYPNPFNATVTIEYALPEQSKVSIDIFDLLGRKIDTIVDETRQAGYHQASWNAGQNSTGVYFYSIKAGDFNDTKKMLLLK